MTPMFYVGAGLLLVFVFYKIIQSIITSRYHARRAEALGCERALQRPYKLPFAFDILRRLNRADKANVLPNVFEEIYNELRVGTWEQYFLGDRNFATVEPKNIQALLATQFNDFEIGPLRRGNFFPLFGNGIFTADGKNWEHSRAMLRPQFARQQIADLELEEDHVQDLFKHLPTGSQGWTVETDLSPLFFRLTLDSATEFLFGKSVDSQIAALPDRAESKKKAAVAGQLDWTAFGPAFDAGTMALGYRGRMAHLYWMYNPQSFKDDCKTVQKFADYYVNLALTSATPEEDSEKGHKKGKYVFLQELVKSTRDPTELRSQLLNILLAGRDTTAGLLGWVFYLIARDPARFQKLRQSILDSFGPYSEKPRNITFEALKSCTYLQYVLNETLRLFPNVPLNTRRATKDTTLPTGGGPDGKSPVYIKKGQEVNYMVHVMHRRKDIWGPDALEFKPERWSGRRPGWEFLPFNGGPRICLGQQFALTEAGYVIVRMLQRFDQIQNCDSDPIPKHTYSVTTSPLKVPLRLHDVTATS